MPNPGPATTITEHPIGGGGSPSYVGVSGGAVGFYQNPYNPTVTAVTQRSNAFQMVLSVSAAGGLLSTFQTLSQQVPSITQGQVSSTAITFSGGPQVSSVDLLIVNKNTPVPGQGIGNVRVSAAAIQVTCANIQVHLINASGGTLNASPDTFNFAVVRGFVNSVTLTPAVVLGNTVQEQQFNVPGLAPGMVVPISKPSDQQSIGIAGTRVVSNGVLGISFVNTGVSAVTPTAAEVYNYAGLAGIASTINILSVGVFTSAAGMVSGVTNESITAQMIAVTGVQANDRILGVGTRHGIDQPGLSLISARVSGANVIAMAWLNSLSSIAAATRLTPTANDTFVLNLNRPGLQSPMVVYSVALSPGIVGVSTTSEQSFTVTGLINPSVVHVSKQGFTSGLGVVGYRVSAANTLGITFVNPTNVSITPPTETYLVANFLPVFGQGHYTEQVVSPLAVAGVQMSNELRNALAAMGLIGGS